MTITLRPYQQNAIDEIYENFRNENDRVLLYMIMGAGKTNTACKMIYDCLKSGISVSFIVKRRELIKQTSKVFKSWGIDHGINMANHYMYSPKKLVQLSSIDTLRSRNIFPESENIFIDECQDSNSEAYERIKEHYYHKKVIGMSGTPFRDNSYFQAIVNPITAPELVSMGVLTPEKVYAPSTINTENVGIKAGEFNLKELAIESSKITGDLISHWRKYAENRPTLIFAVSVEHSKDIVKSFIADGIPSAHADAKTPSEERNKIANDLKSGKIKVVSNVDIFSVGFDLPEISCIVLARPTMSLLWHLQATARGMRSCKGKSNCIVLDHSGNYLRHGFVLVHREATLEHLEKTKKSTVSNIRQCEKCFYIYEKNVDDCPNCGFHRPIQEREINYDAEGELEELHLSVEVLEKISEKEFCSHYYKTDWVRKARRLGEDFAYIQTAKKFGIEKCNKYGDKIRMPQWIRSKKW